MWFGLTDLPSVFWDGHSMRLRRLRKCDAGRWPSPLAATGGGGVNRPLRKPVGHCRTRCSSSCDRFVWSDRSSAVVPLTGGDRAFGSAAIR
eukprot:356011-Chlamydomonas_euryale.AAC.3